MKTVSFGQRTEEWLEWRKLGVSASEAAIIMNASPYMTPWRLWAEKSGLAEPDDLSKNPFVQYGIEYEDVARQAFEAQNPGEVALPVCAESSEEPILRASFDGLISQRRPVELKCPSTKVFEEVQRQGVESEAYKLYWHQVQHQMYVSGGQEGFLVFYHENYDLEVFQIGRDEMYLERLVLEAKRFFDRVRNGNPPAKHPERDVLIPTGSVAEQWVDASESFKVYQAEIEALEKKVQEYKDAQAQHKEVLKGLLGDFYTGQYNGVRVNRYFREGKVDYDAYLRDNHPDDNPKDLSKYRKASSEVFRVTVTDNELPAWSLDESAKEEAEEIKAESGPSLFW